MQINPKDGGEVLHVTSQHQIELDSLARVIRFRMGARKGPTNFAIGRYKLCNLLKLHRLIAILNFVPQLNVFNLNLRRTSPLEHNNSMEGTPLDQEAK